MLEVKNVRKSFHRLEVLKGVDLTVDQGDVVAILGPQRFGKDYAPAVHQFSGDG